MLIEEFVVKYLEDELSVPVSGSEPTPMPQRFVTVERTGSSCRNKLRSAAIAVQAWAESLDEAANLCAVVVTTMEAIVSEPEISRCVLSANYNFTDEETNRYRYQADFDLVHYLN